MLDEVEDARNAILVAHIVLLYTFAALKMRIVNSLIHYYRVISFNKENLQCDYVQC